MDHQKPRIPTKPILRDRWTWGFRGRTKSILTCGNHPMVRYLQRVLGVNVPDDYRVPVCQEASIFWMIRRELAHSQDLSEEQASLLDSNIRRVRDQGYFMSPNGVVIIFRRAEISTIYQLSPERRYAVNQLEFSGPSPFSLDPEPHYLPPFPVELLLVPEPITKEWWNGIQAWIRHYNTKKSLFCESGICVSHPRIIAEDTPVDLIELPSSNSFSPNREIIRPWIKNLMNSSRKEPVFGILRSPNLLCSLLHQLASRNARLATWKEHYVSGIVYGIDRSLPETDQIQFFPLCI